MKGITVTQEIKNQLQERIDFLKNKINYLEEQRNSAKVNNNGFATHERLKSINPDWRMQMTCYKNELYFTEDILKDAVVACQ